MERFKEVVSDSSLVDNSISISVNDCSSDIEATGAYDLIYGEDD